MLIEVSDNLKKLSKYFPENLYVVGGYVRNKLLGISSSDVDLASSVDIEEVSKRLSDSEFSVKVKNPKLGAVLICKGKDNYEYTAFRKDVCNEDGSSNSNLVVSTDKIEDDAVRRDFSVNSIYYNINKDEIVDLHHGVVDLNQKIIRCNTNPDNILKNDGERILRMVRIAGELNFHIDKKTLKSAAKFAENLKNITGNIKFAEIEKILYCDQRYNLNKKGQMRALKILNVLGIWQYFGLKNKTVRYKMVLRTADRLLGLLIDIVDTEKPEGLQAFLENFLKEQFGLGHALINKIFVYLSGYYSALQGMKNKEFFLKYYQDWAYIFPLLGQKSKRIQSRYSFFYQYIIEHGLAIEISDLAINDSDIKENFKNIDKRNYDKILKNLLSKVFDGKVSNKKEALLEEIGKKLQNF